MRIFLLLLSVLCAAQVHGIFDCPRKDPPPGALVLSPGSKLVLTCKGHVMVDGIKVRNGSNTSRRGRSLVAPATTASITNNRRTMHSAVTEGDHFNREAEVSTVTEETGSPRPTDTTYTACPTTHHHMGQPTSVGDSGSEAEEVDGEGDYEGDDYEEEEGSRVTRGIKSRPQWKWNGRTVGKGKRDSEVTLDRRGAALSLSSVRETDSGKYTCHHRGREKFSLKVIVADPPETPSLSCYKKSPSSKIRCEWAPQRPVNKQESCYFSLSKRPADTFIHFQCSYSSRLSRYWYALDHNDDELRTIHMAYLCITSIAGNVTSPLLPFIPMDILKPDPPSDIRVKEVEGHDTWIKVTWNFPTSWKTEDEYYKLVFEVKYKPLGSSFYHDQVKTVKYKRSYTVLDAMPGVKYLIQVRTKEEYDGDWSEWSAPVNASSWTVQMISDDLITTAFPEEGSTDENMPDVVPSGTEGVEVSYHILWISGLFVLLAVILAAYIFRHKVRLMSKLHRVAVIQSGDSSQPPTSTPAAAEGQALMTFTRPRYKEPPPSEAEAEEEENEEEQMATDRTEAMHFNNTSYFLIQQA